MPGVEEKLKKFIEEVTKDKGYANGAIEVEPISSGGANYTSALYLATVSAPPKEDLKLFAKVANVGEGMRAATNNMFGLIYEKERYFYAEIAVAFEKLYNKNQVPEEKRLYIPKYYGFKSSETEETLVLENLAAKGYGNFDRFKTVNWEYASKALEELAKFHALGLAYRQENPGELDKVTKLLPEEFMTSGTFLESYIANAKKIGTEVIKEEYRERMKILFEKSNLIENATNKIWMSTSGGFLKHGDYRPSNLMHRRRGGKLEVVPLDYQTYNLGDLATDLMYFIVSGSDGNFRKYNYEQLIEHYYKELTRSLQDLHVDINEVYPRKVFEKELEEAKVTGLIVGLTLTSLLTVDTENAPKFENFDSLFVTPNQLALDRVNDIVADFIRWGII